MLDSKEALDLVVEAIEAAGYTGKIEIGMDVAASEFYVSAPLPCATFFGPIAKSEHRTDRTSRPNGSSQMDPTQAPACPKLDIF